MFHVNQPALINVVVSGLERTRFPCLVFFRGIPCTVLHQDPFPPRQILYDIPTVPLVICFAFLIAGDELFHVTCPPPPTNTRASIALFPCLSFHYPEHPAPSQPADVFSQRIPVVFPNTYTTGRECLVPTSPLATLVHVLSVLPTTTTTPLPPYSMVFVCVVSYAP